MRVARWDICLGVVPLEEDVPRFRDLRLVALRDAGQLLLCPDEGGTPLHFKARSRGRPLYAYEFKHTAVLGGLDGVPRFALHDVELEVLDDGVSMLWDMPPAHELPWVAFVNDMPRSKMAVVAERELRLRVESAGYEDPGLLSDIAVGVPNWARGVVDPSLWKSIFQDGGDRVRP